MRAPLKRPEFTRSTEQDRSFPLRQVCNRPRLPAQDPRVRPRSVSVTEFASGCIRPWREIIPSPLKLRRTAEA